MHLLVVWLVKLLKNAIFDKRIQLLLHSKVARAELYLIGGYHNE